MASITRNEITKKWEFVFDYYDKKSNKRKQVRRRGFRSRREANEKMIELQSEVQQSQYVGTKHTTLNEFAEYWLENIRRLEVGPATFYNNHLYWKNHVKGSLGELRLQNIRLEDCQLFVKELAAKKLARNSIDRICTMLKRMLDSAVEHEIVQANYMRKVTLPKRVKSNLNVWTLEQTNHFLISTKDRRYYCAYALALLAGLRQGEILGLRWRDIDWETGTLYVSQTLTFGGKLLKDGAKTAAGERRVSIPGQLLCVLEGQKRRYEELRERLGSRFVDMDIVIFNRANGKTVFPANLLQAYKKDVQRSELPYIRFHDLRHSHATLLMQKGINVKVISERLGHSKIGVTLDIYSHVLPSMQQEVADTLENLITL